MYESIVVGADGSETGKRAVTEATNLAKALGSQLHIVTAYQPVAGAKVDAPRAAAEVWAIQPDAEARNIAEQAQAAARVHVEAESHTVKGDPADALLKIADQESANLIIVGSRGMHGVGRVLGSVPNKVSHRARCNVLIVATEDD
jgi:nucleotide-binding universal stress UspA family protein